MKEDYSNAEIIAIIADRIHSARDRAILCDRFVNGITYEKLAEAYGLSVPQIKRIVYKGQDKIFR